MRRSLVLFVLSLIAAAPVGAAPRRASAPARKPRPAAPAKKTPPVKKPAAPAFRSLAAFPQSVALDGPGAEQRLLLTGQPVSGPPADLSRAAVYKSGNPKVAQVTRDGLVRAVADGDGWIEARAGGRGVRVPVRVRNSRALRPVSFVHEVMPVLSQAGCNSSTCHAKQGNKSGFQLSVLAFDLETDHAAIARVADGRRVNVADPGNSLLLKKATAALPHAGGQRFRPDSAEARLVARWIAEGARYDGEAERTLVRVEVEPRERVMLPEKQQQLLVTAVYSDGSRRDVTPLAQYQSDETAVAEVTDAGRLKTTPLPGEAAVMARFMGQVAGGGVTVSLHHSVPASAYGKLPRNNFIDDLVYRKLAQLNVLPSGPCDDATFLRRASLDLIGTLPMADEAREFLAACEKERGPSGTVAPRARKALVDSLLERPEYADYWGMRWSNLLLVNPDLLLPRGAYAFDRWLRDSFRRNMPFDQFAREIVTASGETYREGPPNFFRALSEPGAAGKSISQLFLGVRLDCAECHHHPFERWGQDDYYSLAAFFARVKSKSSYPEGYHSIVYAGSSGEVKHPRTGQVMPPRPLGGEPLEIPEEADRRQALADWMTSPENPFFARAIVNRMWGLLMGRGLVEPVDDFRMTNPATNEALLDALAKDFVSHGYDLKHLLRTITASAAYQRSSESTPENVKETRSYSRYYKKRPPGEVLLDAVSQVTGVPQTFRAYPEGTRAIQMWDSRLQVEFLEIFGRPVRQSVCECERPTDGSVTQMLHMMNSEQMHRRLTHDTGAAAELDKSGKPEEEVVRELYLRVLSRYPTAEEIAAARTAFTREKATRRQAIEDILWALMNSAEFILNH
ncbi:MAG: DUF1553 domain-containing protein [Armatimonadota bacterium]